MIERSKYIIKDKGIYNYYHIIKKCLFNLISFVNVSVCDQVIKPRLEL